MYQRIYTDKIEVESIISGNNCFVSALLVADNDSFELKFDTEINCRNNRAIYSDFELLKRT